MYELGMIYAVVALVLFFSGFVLDFVFDMILGEYLEQIGFAMLALVGVVWGVLAIVSAVVAVVTAIF